jgi:hypothetical protein
MSAEITRGADYSIATDAAYLAAEILIRTDSPTHEALSYGMKSARYGAEVLLSALREMGAVSGDLDTELFKDALQKVDTQVLPAGHLVGATRIGEELVRSDPSHLGELRTTEEPLADLWNRLAGDPNSGITEELRKAIIAGRQKI